MKKAALALALGTLALLSFPAVGETAGRRATPVAAPEAGFQPTKARYTRRYAVRTYRGRRIGFYSYTYRDVINTYGMSRARYAASTAIVTRSSTCRRRMARSTTGFSSTRG